MLFYHDYFYYIYFGCQVKIIRFVFVNFQLENLLNRNPCDIQFYSFSLILSWFVFIFSFLYFWWIFGDAIRCIVCVFCVYMSHFVYVQKLTHASAVFSLSFTMANIMFYAQQRIMLCQTHLYVSKCNRIAYIFSIPLVKLTDTFLFISLFHFISVFSIVCALWIWECSCVCVWRRFLVLLLLHCDDDVHSFVFNVK